MADVVRQRQRLGQLRVQAQSAGQRARNLRNFKRVRQAAAEVVARRLARSAGKDLRLARQAAKGARVQYARRIARKGSAVSVRRLSEGAPGKGAGRGAIHGDCGRQVCRGLNDRLHLHWKSPRGQTFERQSASGNNQ